MLTQSAAQVRSGATLGGIANAGPQVFRMMTHAMISRLSVIRTTPCSVHLWRTVAPHGGASPSHSATTKGKQTTSQTCNNRRAIRSGVGKDAGAARVMPTRAARGARVSSAVLQMTPVLRGAAGGARTTWASLHMGSALRRAAGGDRVPLTEWLPTAPVLHLAASWDRVSEAVKAYRMPRTPVPSCA